VLSWRSRPAAVPVLPPTPVAAGAAPTVASSGTPAAIVVAIAGKVHRPGVLTLRAGARVADAVRAAGGPLPGADVGLLNLARRLTDGELVVVGVPGADAAAAAAAPGAGGAVGQPGAGAPVNLNSATLDQLDGLPGVGPVLAQRIVDWRTAHGPFGSVEQLRDVDGIGDSKFAQLRDKVVV